MAQETSPSPAKTERARKVRQVVLEFVATVLGLYLVVCALAFFAQRYILFPAPKPVRTPPTAAGKIITVDGGTVVLYQKPTNNNNPVLVYFHGNGDQLADLDWISTSLSRMGVGFAGIEYPGYGLAADRGSPSESAIFDAAERGINHLIEKEGISKEQIVLGGHSLGTGVAMAMAARGFGVRVLLLAPFTSVPDVASNTFPLLPSRFILKDHFDSLSRAKQIHVPVLVVHGDNDKLIPMAQGRTLVAALSNAQFIAIPNGNHNGMWSHPEATEKMFAFVRAGEAKPQGAAAQ